jgi:hypothetical protein
MKYLCLLLPELLVNSNHFTIYQICNGMAVFSITIIYVYGEYLVILGLYAGPSGRTV